VSDEYGCFSNFSNHGFELNGKQWITSEHYFQAHKFESFELQEMVRNAKTPMDAARIGRNRIYPLREDWEDVKVTIMRKAIKHKFAAHSYLSELLLSTGEQEIIEDTENDYYWGCGKKGSGKNMLGKILMELRAELLRVSKNKEY